MALAQLLVDDAVAEEYIRRYRKEWSHVRPLLDGHDLVALGLSRGPFFGNILRSLRAERLDGRMATRDDELPS